MTNRFHFLPAEARRVLLFVNPKAGARSARPLAEELAARLRKQGFDVETITNVQKLVELASRTWQAQTLRAVVAAGGDGTAQLAVSSVPVGVPVALLPLGTENLLAKCMGIVGQPERVCRVIQRGVYVKLDAGSANGRLFLLMAGCGFDAEVVRRLHSRRSGHIHHLSYAKPILESIRSYEYPALRVYCLEADDERRLEPVIAGAADAENTAAGEQLRFVDQSPVASDNLALRKAEPDIVARWVFVVNLPQYAGGLRLAPRATATDGLLDVCTFKQGSLWNGLRYLSGIWMGQHEQWDDCVMRRVRRVRIEADVPVPYQLDGDPGGVLPLEVELLPARLALLVPEK